MLMTSHNAYPKTREVSAIVPSTQAYAIVDFKTQRVLDSINGNEQRQVASLTKIAAAMVVIDWLETSQQPPTSMAFVPRGAFEFGGPNPLGFFAGDSVSVRDLLYAALLQSDNIAAYTLAEYVGERLIREGRVTITGKKGPLTPQEVFVRQMNALAVSLEMFNTLFSNPHGLDHMKGKPPYSTAEDMARMAIYAIKRPAFHFKVSQQQREITINRYYGQVEIQLLKNTNTLLGEEGIDGIKTGLTSLAGGCLALSAEKPPITWKHREKHFRIDRRLVVILLGSTNRFNDGLRLMQWGWVKHKNWYDSGGPGSD